MKRFWPLIAWFIAGAVLGLLADGVLFRLWSKVGILLPVGHWLDSHGGDVLVKGWFILWVNATSWVLAVLGGILAGRLLKRHILRCLLAFGVGFAFVPFAVNGYVDSEMLRFSLVGWHMVSIALVVVCGLLFHRWRAPNHQRIESTGARVRGAVV